MNILTNKHIMSALEVLQIRDKIKELDEELKKMSQLGETNEKLKIDDLKARTLINLIYRYFSSGTLVDKLKTG